MLRIVATDTKEERHSLSLPLSAVLSRDINTPADSLSLEFPSALWQELAFISVYDDDKEIFSGVVDEQIIILHKNARTKLVCRSKAAFLLDNEAKPQSFRDVSAKLIFERYAKPFGFKLADVEDASLKGSFVVKKGVSCWQVLQDFSKAVWGAVPYVFGDTLFLNGKASESEVVFSDCGKGVAFTSLEYNRLRCKLISKVRVKLKSGEDYNALVTSTDAQDRKVVRERYINATELSSKTLADAERLIGASKTASEIIVLTVPFCMTDALAVCACVESSEIGRLDGFCVTGIRYSFSENEEFTRLTLKRKEN
ncbi:MAG: hypothetical protein IJD93_06290 [Ruminococcus sp.]|nr:hypothetical protein [Ruminococcus sp.]